MYGFARRCNRGATEVFWMRAFSTLALTVAVAGMAFGEDVKIPLVKKRLTGAASIFSTTSLQPQIAKPRPPPPERTENPTQPLRIGPANTLVAGTGALPVDRVTPLTAKFPGISATGWEPPDCDIAVGPNHVVQVVNSDIAFFRKSDGGKVLQQGFDTFFAGVGLQSNFLFDPKAFYDPIAKRFFVLCLEQDDGAKVSKLLLAVSDDTDPNGNWFRYRIEAKTGTGSSEAWLDYPGFSSNKDAVVITGNQFGFAGGYFGASFVVIQKAPLLTGGTATIFNYLDVQSFTAQAARTADGFVDRIYTVSSSDSTTSLKIHAITNLLATPTLTSTTISVPGYNPPLDFVRGPNGIVLDSLDSRSFTSNYRAGTLVAAHNISVSASDKRIATRWYEVRTSGWPGSGSTPSLIQSGNVVGAGGESLHMPAINVNSRGAISLLFSRTSASVMADVMIASRAKGDALGKMSAPKQLATSRGLFQFPQNRWGDYFACVMDPNDDLTFWGNGETCGADGAWATEIVTWKVNDASAATVYAAGTPSIMQGLFQRGNAGSLVAVDQNTYDVKTKPVTGLGQVATWESSVTTNLSPTTIEFLSIKWNLIAPSATTQFLFAWNWSTGQYDVVATRPVKAGTTESVDILTNMTKYVSAGGTIKLAVRGLQPVRNGAMPLAFSMRTDLLQVLALKRS